MTPSNPDYYNHLQINGKTDDEQLIAIISYLHEVQEIPRKFLKRDYFILISESDGATVTGPYRSLTQEQTIGNIVHRPDIIILNEKSEISMIIELDGSFHHSNSGLKKTRIRNENYDNAGIKYVVIDILDLKYLETSWFVFLDHELTKIFLVEKAAAIEAKKNKRKEEIKRNRK